MVEKEKEITSGKASAQTPCYLLLCPFCGSKAEQSQFWRLPGVEHYTIKCIGCNCSVVADSQEKIVEQWNTRAGTWIDIDIQKPELNTWCFVSDGTGTHFAAYMDGLGFLGADGEALDSWVRFWMPLPS